MSIEELKKQYHAGIISLMEYTHKTKKFKDELNVLYPQEISLSGKSYLYLHGLDVSEGWCTLTNRERTFISMKKGYRKFCGNLGACQCNLTAKSDFWKSTNHEQITKKRKQTVRKKYGVDSVSQLVEIKDKIANTCLKRYGTKSPTQNPEILNKSSMTCLKNNGKARPQQSKDIY